MTKLYFEDFVPGTERTFGSHTFNAEEIVAFAREFDPQPMHLDAGGGGSQFYGSLIASGWHAAGVMMRLMCDGYILNSSSMGSPGVEELRWLKPVRPDDTLTLRLRILDTRASRTRPDMGLIHTATELIGADGTPAVTMVSWGMMGRRNPGPVVEVQAGAGDRKSTAEATAVPSLATRTSDDGPGHRAPLLDDVEVGRMMCIGSYEFTPQNIKAFASKFDPQPFHLDEEAARQSHFGALCSSGWHTGCAWMRLMIDHRVAQMKAAARDGERMAQIGPSPGFRNLRWLKPSYAGDTITYYSIVADKKPSASRPGWGILFSKNVGENQRGERVFEFDGAVFYERATS